MEKSRIILIALVIFVLIVGVFVITYILGSLGEPQTQINQGSSSGSNSQNQGSFGSGSGSSGSGTNNPIINNPITNNSNNNQGGSTRPSNRTTSLVSKKNYQFYDSNNPLYLNDSLTKRKTTIDSDDMPWVLADSVFRGAETVSYEQKLVIGNFPKLIYGKQPADNNTVTDTILLSYDPLTPSYYLRVIFDEEIDFTAASSLGKSLLLFGKNFTIDESTDEESIVLTTTNDTELILEDDGDVYLDEDKLNNVRVEFDGNFTDTDQISFEIIAENRDKDAILKDGNFRDPVFGTFRIEYQGLNIDESSGEREMIKVSSSSTSTRMSVDFKDHRGNQANFFWINGAASLNLTEPRLADEQGNRIVTFEQAPIIEEGYVIVGSNDNGYILKLETLNNHSSGFSSDQIIFKDITNSETYTVQINSEGKGTLTIGGQNYGVVYNNNNVRLDHPETAIQSGVGKGIAFKTIKTNKGAKILFYQPTVMNFNTLANLYGNTPQKVNIFLPTHEGFMEVAFSAQENENGRWWGQGPNGGGVIDTNSNTSMKEYTDGLITYTFVGEGIANRSTVYLKDKNNNLIKNPAIIIFEEQTSFPSQNKKDALILKIRENPTGNNPMIVEQVQLMYGNWIFSRLNNTGSLIEKSFNRYGTTYIKDGSNGKYVNTTISYPNNQVFGSVRIKEL